MDCCALRGGQAEASRIFDYARVGGNVRTTAAGESYEGKFYSNEAGIQIYLKADANKIDQIALTERIASNAVAVTHSLGVGVYFDYKTSSADLKTKLATGYGQIGSVTAWSGAEVNFTGMQTVSDIDNGLTKVTYTPTVNSSEGENPYKKNLSIGAGGAEYAANEAGGGSSGGQAEASRILDYARVDGNVRTAAAGESYSGNFGSDEADIEIYIKADANNIDQITLGESKTSGAAAVTHSLGVGVYFDYKTSSTDLKTKLATGYGQIGSVTALHGGVGAVTGIQTVSNIDNGLTKVTYTPTVNCSEGEYSWEKKLSIGAGGAEYAENEAGGGSGGAGGGSPEPEGGSGGSGGASGGSQEPAGGSGGAVIIIEPGAGTAMQAAIAGGQAAMGTAAAARTDNNDIMRRMGDLRFAGDKTGGWVRHYAGENAIQGNATVKYSAVQGGYDWSFDTARGKWFAGLTVSRNNGSLKLNNGDGSTGTTMFGVYGSWLGKRGHFIDLIAKQGHSESDFSTYGSGHHYKASYDNNVTSLSAEYGYRKKLTRGYYLEPQAELTYGHVTGCSYNMSLDGGTGADITQDAINSFIGRVGINVGRENRNGSWYGKVSLAHEFDADSTITGRSGSATISNTTGGSDTWVEFGLGFTQRVGHKTYLYGELEKSTGSVVREKWRSNFGLRVSF